MRKDYASKSEKLNQSTFDKVKERWFTKRKPMAILVDTDKVNHATIIDLAFYKRELEDKFGDRS